MLYCVLLIDINALYIRATFYCDINLNHFFNFISSPMQKLSYYPSTDINLCQVTIKCSFPLLLDGTWEKRHSSCRRFSPLVHLAEQYRKASGRFDDSSIQNAFVMLLHFLPLKETPFAMLT